jgi:hypothetical protein
VPFGSGSISFRRLVVSYNDAASPVGDELIQKARNNHFTGSLEEVEYGWVGPVHMYDGEMSVGDTIYADAVHLGLRIDTNKVPGNVRKAHVAMEEAAVAANNPSGFISKAQKKEVKESVKAKLEEEVKEGKHCRSKVVPILWDVPRRVMYTGASGATLEKLLEITERTWGVAAEPITAGSMIAMYAEKNGITQQYEDLRPTRFMLGAQGEGVYPDYPWVSKSTNPKDFVGNEFLLWLWYADNNNGGVIKTDNGDVTIFIDRSLDLECAYGQTGKENLTGDGPSKTPEAMEGLRTGKMPRKAGLIVDHENQQFSFKLLAESMTFNSTKLPEVEDAETPRALFEERVSLLADCCHAVDVMFKSFCALRLDTAAWSAITINITAWIEKGK